MALAAAAKLTVQERCSQMRESFDRFIKQPVPVFEFEKEIKDIAMRCKELINPKDLSSQRHVCSLQQHIHDQLKNKAMRQLFLKTLGVKEIPKLAQQPTDLKRAGVPLPTAIVKHINGYLRIEDSYAFSQTCSSIRRDLADDLDLYRVYALSQPYTFTKPSGEIVSWGSFEGTILIDDLGKTCLYIGPDKSLIYLIKERRKLVDSILLFHLTHECLETQSVIRKKRVVIEGRRQEIKKPKSIAVEIQLLRESVESRPKAAIFTKKKINSKYTDKIETIIKKQFNVKNKNKDAYSFLESRFNSKRDFLLSEFSLKLDVDQDVFRNDVYTFAGNTPFRNEYVVRYGNPNVLEKLSPEVMGKLMLDVDARLNLLQRIAIFQAFLNQPVEVDLAVSFTELTEIPRDGR